VETLGTLTTKAGRFGTVTCEIYGYGSLKEGCLNCEEESDGPDVWNKTEIKPKRNWNKTVSSVVGWNRTNFCFSSVSVLFQFYFTYMRTVLNSPDWPANHALLVTNLSVSLSPHQSGCTGRTQTPFLPLKNCCFCFSAGTFWLWQLRKWGEALRLAAKQLSMDPLNFIPLIT